MADKDGPQDLRRRRKSGPKVKTGCQTCKIRRIKCDESKPVCQRCASTKRACGYTPIFSYDSTASNSTLKLLDLQGSIPGTRDEKRGFHHYLQKTGPELSSHYDTTLWEYFLVQASLTEPALRHAIVGLGSLHEAFQNKLLDYSPNAIERGFAVKQYIKGICLLRQSLATNGGSQQLIVTLLACILFSSFDSIRGYLASALVHLRSGIKILHDLKLNSRRKDAKMLEMLACALARLSLQLFLYADKMSFADRRSMAGELSELTEQEVRIPAVFKTLDDARNIFNLLFLGVFRITMLLDMDSLPSAHKDIQYLLAENKNQLAHWQRAFAKFLRANAGTLSDRETRGSAVLQVQYLTAYIIHTTIPTTDNGNQKVGHEAYNLKRLIPHMDDFRRVVDLSQTLIMDCEADAKNGKSPMNFCVDMAVIGPLLMCCCKCPDRAVRRAALDVLRRCPRREGMLDSAVMVELIQETWKLRQPYEFEEQEIVDEQSQLVPLHSVVDLIFEDGMKWRWACKEKALKTKFLRRSGDREPMLHDEKKVGLQGHYN